MKKQVEASWKTARKQIKKKNLYQGGYKNEELCNLRTQFDYP